MSLPFDKDLRGVKVYLKPGPTDFRKGISTTISLIVGRMQIKMTDKSLFLFCSTDKKQIRILYRDGAGVWLLQRRIKYGRFPYPQNNNEASEISYEALKELISDPIPLETLKLNGIVENIETHL
jgi:hypothetical protein